MKATRKHLKNLKKCAYRRRIKNFLTERELTAKEFCNIHGICPIYFSQIMSLKCKITLRMAYLIAKATFGVVPAIDMLVETEHIFKNKKTEKDYLSHQLKKHNYLKFKRIKKRVKKIRILDPYA